MIHKFADKYALDIQLKRFSMFNARERAGVPQPVLAEADVNEYGRKGTSHVLPPRTAQDFIFHSLQHLLVYFAIGFVLPGPGCPGGRRQLYDCASGGAQRAFQPDL